MQGRFNTPWWSVPHFRDPPPSLVRFDSLRQLPPPGFGSPSLPRTPPGSPPAQPPPPPDSPPPSSPSSDPPPPPPPGYDSPPSSPPTFSYGPPPGFNLSTYLPPAQNQFLPRQLSNPRFPPFYSPAVQDPTQPLSQDRSTASSVVLPPQARPETRTTRSRDHLFEPVSLPPSTRRRGQASGSGSRPKSTPAPQGRITPAPKNPSLQEDKRLDQVRHVQKLTIGQAESQKPNESTMEEGEIRGNSEDLASSRKSRLEASSAAGNQGDRSQDQVGHPKKSTPRKAKAQRPNDRRSAVDDTSNTTEKGLTKERQLQELISTKRIELEASKVAADSQEQDGQDQASREGELDLENKKEERQRNQTSNEGFQKEEQQDQAIQGNQPTPGQGKARKPTNNNIALDDDASTEADRDEPVASVFAAIQGEKTRVCAGHEDQSTLGKSKGKRQKDQMSLMEYASSTSGGEIRERKMQKLTSSGKAGLEASVNVSLTAPPIALGSPSHHNEEESGGSLSSSTLDWACNFDETSTTDLRKSGDDGEMVMIGNYLVEAKHSITMHAIMRKHGDIAKNIKSTMFQSLVLRAICEIVQGLKIPLKQLSHEVLARYVSYVKEAAKMGMNVGWLEHRLDEISETVDAMKEFKSIRDAVEMKNEEIENLERELAMLAIEKGKRGAVIDEIKGSLKSTTLEIRKKKSTIKDIKLKCKNRPRKFMDGLYKVQNVPLSPSNSR